MRPNPKRLLIRALPYPVFIRLFGLLQRRVVWRQYERMLRWTNMRPLTHAGLAEAKTSDTLFILGSGPSINAITAERWKRIAEHDTAAMNFWLIHPFVPKFYFYEEIVRNDSPEMHSAFVQLAHARCHDYTSTIKVASEVHWTEAEMTKSLPEQWGWNLFAALPVNIAARNETQLRYALDYLWQRGYFARSARFRSLVKYGSSLSMLLAFAVRMGYRNVVLCGIDLKTGAYFYQDPELYPETRSLSFIDPKQKHLTYQRGPWLVPMDGVVKEMGAAVLEPAGVNLFVENRSSALWPEIPEAPEAIFSPRAAAAPSKPVVSTRAATPGSLRQHRPARPLVGLSPHSIVTRALTREEWALAIRPLTRSSYGEFALLNAPRGAFFADPFVLSQGEADYIFFENFDFALGKGSIYFIRATGGGDWTDPALALQRPYHLSYPFLFKWNGAIFMIPETSRNRTIELYRAIHFPKEWQLEKVLMKDINASDTTLHVGPSGEWWMFTSIADSDKPALGPLHLFSSRSPLGSWVAHPKNPVVSDQYTSRPAGALFVEEGQLIRPSQDCTRAYGESVILNRVETLSESEYTELPFDRIRADFLDGFSRTHTVNHNERWEVRDVMRYALKAGLPRWLRRR